MKSVLISIQPKWCELITSGKKTVEVRKTKPKLETPFKCYIYCTKGETVFHPRDIFGNDVLNGKVIGEFVCDEIFPIRVFENGSIQDYVCHGMERSCVPYNNLAHYIGYGCSGYGWCISNVVMYDKPRELSEFSHCGVNYHFNPPITRPPQSWCYVESEG
jgi:predicted transcriptional regulator